MFRWIASWFWLSGAGAAVVNVLVGGVFRRAQPDRDFRRFDNSRVFRRAQPDRDFRKL